MSDDIQQALDFLRSEREREEEVYVVHLSTGYGIEHVWTMLDYLARIEPVFDAACAVVDFHRRYGAVPIATAGVFQEFMSAVEKARNAE